ncbi:hypothetical protein V5799_003190 [Amblyomma americanum]|uniref:Uncharacterized protein n=1 Tax=Amblyomma americanum TaxID=6943 RepID=A0AAQ4D9N5_AMBAM
MSSSTATFERHGIRKLAPCKHARILRVCSTNHARESSFGQVTKKAVTAASRGTGIVPGLCIEVELRFKKSIAGIEEKLKAEAQVFSSKEGRRCTFLAIEKHLQGHSKHAFINEVTEQRKRGRKSDRLLFLVEGAHVETTAPFTDVTVKGFISRSSANSLPRQSATS